MSNKQTVFRTEWFSVEEESFDHIESLKGKPYYRVNSPDGVIILALTETNEIILVKQFRPAFNQHTLEFPSGAINESESPEEAAARELYEETGYVCKALNCLGAGRIMMNRHNSREFAFLGMGAVRDSKLEDTEEYQVVLVTLADFKELVLSGQFEQFAALALFVLAGWKLGSQFVGLTGMQHAIG
jgi:ADP-ribose pyrophosphatase